MERCEDCGDPVSVDGRPCACDLQEETRAIEEARGHAPECQRRRRQYAQQRALYLALWGRTYCLSCGGWAGMGGHYDPSPSGVALSPGSMPTWDSCGCVAPTSHGLRQCPRCGAVASRGDWLARLLREGMDAVQGWERAVHGREEPRYYGRLGSWPRGWRAWRAWGDPAFRAWWRWRQAYRLERWALAAGRWLARPLERWPAIAGEELFTCGACGWRENEHPGLPLEPECLCGEFELSPECL